MAQTINLEDIELKLKCLECGNTYSFYPKKPQSQKTCRCGKGHFDVNIQGVGGKRANIRVHVEFEYANRARKTVEPEEIKIND